MNDAIGVLGLPDDDYLDAVGMETPETNTQGHTTQKYRMLRYENLSEIAIVDIIDFHKDRVHFVFHGKYLGTKKEG